MPVEVVVVEPTGSETQVVAKSGGQEIIACSASASRARPGETIHVAPDPALVHLFDKEIGAAAELTMQARGPTGMAAQLANSIPDCRRKRP